MKKSSKAFTLIELLVVISIIAILASLALVSFTRSQKQARDVKRKSDLKQYQAALENYANGNAGLYPKVSFGRLCDSLGLLNCPNDPDTTKSYSYTYSADGTSYILAASLEAYASNKPYWVVCSNGNSGEYSSPPANGACPF